MLELVPMSLKEANAFVTAKHRHHGEVQGHVFSLGCTQDGNVVGVCTVGRPVARMLQDGWTLEVTRMATDGTKNACSFLYSKAWRAVQGLGHKRLVTYILDTEHGTSLNAAGWRCLGKAGGGSWSRNGRPRVDTHPLQTKIRFEIGTECDTESPRVPRTPADKHGVTEDRLNTILSFV
jgi:hypothetical protein